MSIAQIEEDDDFEGGIYDNGHWLWDDKANELVFKSDLPEICVDAPITTSMLGALEFKEDIDLNEQQRFKKRLQRKVTGDNDVVTLQDIKDVVLFTAPNKILNALIINLLHLPATERLLRALIFFIQYYLQISDTMAFRTIELQYKIRTPNSEETEKQFLENLEDLRLLVAKEYSNLIRGNGEFAKYHHMGPKKKITSQYRRESFMFETFLRISIQIIWIALGRQSLNQIDLEVQRVFKSQVFNSAEHKLKDQYLQEYFPMMKGITEKCTVFTGRCLRKQQKLNILSPLMNEVNCERVIDHRIYGLGIVKYPRLNTRLHFMQDIITLPEKLFQIKDITLGILGMPRSRFDILLREVKNPNTATTTNSSASVSKMQQRSRSKTGHLRSTESGGQGRLYKDIVIPPKCDDDGDLLTEFPKEVCPRRPCDETQRIKWLNRILRIRTKLRSKSIPTT